MPQGSPDLLGTLLQAVSRSFYLTLRILPSPIRRQIGLAYLLARASDTIADAGAASKDERLVLLDAFGQRVETGSGKPLNLAKLALAQTPPGERVLLDRMDEAFAVLESFSGDDQRRIREVLRVIVSGQKLDVERFALAKADHIVPLQNEAELDDYTYRVAGCVGEFWTKMCQAHLFSKKSLDNSFLIRNGIRFGKGLQLVNILRDLPADLRLGRCYLPGPALAQASLHPAELLDPANEPRLRVTFGRYLDLAEMHLEAGWAYTNYLPRTAARVRLACAWPILIGVQTISRLRAANVLDPTQRIKISRKAVRQVLVRSVITYPWPGRWRGLLDAAKVVHRNTLPPVASLAT